MMHPDQRVAILLHEGVRGTHGKTGLTMLRYSEADIVAVIVSEALKLKQAKAMQSSLQSFARLSAQALLAHRSEACENLTLTAHHILGTS